MMHAWMHACMRSYNKTKQNPKTCVEVVFHCAEDLVLLVQVCLQVQVEDHHLHHHVHVLLGQYLICGEAFGFEELYGGRMMARGFGEWHVRGE